MTIVLGPFDLAISTDADIDEPALVLKLGEPFTEADAEQLANVVAQLSSEAVARERKWMRDVADHFRAMYPRHQLKNPALTKLLGRLYDRAGA